MLLNFKVKNYLSFKDEAWFSLEANKKIRVLSENKNIIKLKNQESIWLLKSALFYGANASGKTNILKWIDFLKYITLNSFKFDIWGWIEHEFLKPFLLDIDSQNKDIDFEIEFIIENQKYKYILSLNDKEILIEKLFLLGINDLLLINRQKDNDISIEEDFFWFNEDDFDKLNLYPRNNQTFVSILADRDSKWLYLATKIVKFFKWINYVGSKADFTWYTLWMLEKKEIKNTILKFINNADISIEDIIQEEKELKTDLIFWIIEINWKRLKPNKVIETNFVHPVYKDWQKVSNIWFDFSRQESEWTKKLFSLLWPVLETINNNWVLLIDEVDTHMHFLLIENLIKFIHWLDSDWNNNINNSQFVFNTHNLDLLDLELFRKDQIYFTSKDSFWATEIYSLDDFKDIQIRNNSDVKKAYKMWVFGWIPILSDFYL